MTTEPTTSPYSSTDNARGLDRGGTGLIDVRAGGTRSTTAGGKPVEPSVDVESQLGAPAAGPVVAIHQPNYFPYLGVFHKLSLADAFVYLDDVQFVRRGFINRNRIKTSQGVQWLTIPCRVKGNYFAAICDIIPQWEVPWTRTHRRTLEQNYRAAPHFEEVMHRVVDPALKQAEEERGSLADVNIIAFERVCDYLGLRVPCRRASELGVQGSPTERLIALTQRMGGRIYLSGPSGRRYMDQSLFCPDGVDVAYAPFHHPTYAQSWGRFEDNLSILDMLFHIGSRMATFLGQRDLERTSIWSST